MTESVKTPDRSEEFTSSEIIPTDGPGNLKKSIQLNYIDRIFSIGVFFVGFLICFIRDPSILLNPRLYAEDGTFWFADAYNKGWWRPLLSPHTGYLQTFPRVIADIGLLVPLSHLPLLFASVAVIVQVLPGAIVASRRFEHVIPRRGVRLLLAVLYFVIPNASEVNGNLTNAQWHLALLAILVVLAAPQGLAWKIFDVIIIAFSGLTGPFVIALLPIAIIIWVVRRKRWEFILSAEVTVLTVIQITALLTSKRGNFGPLGINLARFLKIFGGEIVGGTFFGQPTLESLQKNHFYLAICAGLFLAATILLFLVTLKAPLELRLFNLFACLVLAASLATPVVTPAGSQWQAMTGLNGSRYWFFPVISIIADVVWLSSYFDVSRFGASLKATPTKLVGVIGIVSIIVLLSFGVREDWSYQPYLPVNWNAQVHRFDLTKSGQTFEFTTNPGPVWHFILKKH